MNPAYDKYLGMTTIVGIVTWLLLQTERLTYPFMIATKVLLISTLVICIVVLIRWEDVIKRNRHISFSEKRVCTVTRIITAVAIGIFLLLATGIPIILFDTLVAVEVVALLRIRFHHVLRKGGDQYG